MDSVTGQFFDVKVTFEYNETYNKYLTTAIHYEYINLYDSDLKGIIIVYDVTINQIGGVKISPTWA